VNEKQKKAGVLSDQKILLGRGTFKGYRSNSGKKSFILGHGEAAAF
jgi:hypothetical protein